MAWRKRLAEYGAVVSLDWRPGEKILCNHPSNASVSDILVLQLGPGRYEVIHANKQFGTLLRAYDDTEIWTYPPELMMSVDAALVYLASKPAPKWVFSSYHRKIYVTPSKLLDAGIAEQASQLGTLVLPPPAQTVRLISGVQWCENATWQTEEWENVGVLLHQPSVAEMRRGILFLDSKRLLEAAERLLPRFRSTLCKRLHLNLTTRTSWPSRSLENMVAAKFKRIKNRPIANRGMPPCVASVLSRKEPLTYQLRFQLAEVLSYTSLEFLREVLAPRLEIDGKTRHKNVEACFHVARKKKADRRPCITRTGVSGLYCVYGAGENGVKECAAQMGYTGNLEEVSISQMWGVQR